jgi:hypothetical protein
VATKTFIGLVLAVIAIGAAVGVAAQTLTGGDAEPSTLAGAGANEEANDATPTPDADGEQPDPTATGTADDSGWTQADGDTDAAGGRFGGFGGGGFAGRDALPIEPITGSIQSLTASSVVLTTTSGAVDVPLAADTPVQLNKTAADADADLVPGTEVTAILARAEEGIVARNITIGDGGLAGFGGRLGGGGGARRGGGGGVGGAGFNAITGTITSNSGGTIVIDTPDGAVEISLADDTPVRISRGFADAGDDLPEGTEITILGRRDEAGDYQAIAITLGSLGLEAGGFGARRGGRQGGGDGFALPGDVVPGVFFNIPE